MTAVKQMYFVVYSVYALQGRALQVFASRRNHVLAPILLPPLTHYIVKVQFVFLLKQNNRVIQKDIDSCDKVCEFW